MPEGQQPRGVTPRPSSGAAAESARLRQCRNGWEQLPYLRCHGGAAKRRNPASEVKGGYERSYPRPRSGAMTGRRYPMPLSQRPGAAGRRSYPMPLSPRPVAVAGRTNPMPEARGGGWEDQPHTMDAWAQEGLEELSHIEGQEGWQWGDTPHPR